MTQVNSSFPGEHSLNSPRRNLQAPSLHAPYPVLPPTLHNDTAYNMGRPMRTPPRPRLNGVQSAPGSTNPIRRRRRPRHSSPAVLQTTNHYVNTNDIPPWRIPGSFPTSTFNHSPSPTLPPSEDSGVQEAEGFDGQIFPTPSYIDDKIRKRVKEPLTPTQITERAKGYVYIFEAVDQPGILKIGSTDRTVTERKEEIEQSCGRLLVEHYRSKLLPSAQRAEKLCHDMLRYYRRPYSCNRCKNGNTARATFHGEWFEISPDVAQNCVGLWTDFLLAQPYNSEGKLNPFWHERLENTEGCAGEERHCDHHIRHQRWRAFISASYLARMKHQVFRVFRDCRCVEFWRKWFMFLLFLSILLYFLHDWIGDSAPGVQLFVSLGYFRPAQLLHDNHVPKKKVVRQRGYF
jgi:hypothetical protein